MIIKISLSIIAVFSLGKPGLSPSAKQQIEEYLNKLCQAHAVEYLFPHASDHPEISAAGSTAVPI